MRRMKTSAKVIIVLFVLGGVFGLYKLAENQGWLSKIAPQGKQEQDIAKGTFSFGGDKEKATPVSKDGDKPIRVSVVTWGGYAGGQYFNNGFKPFEESRFYRDYGVKVEFIVNDDPVASMESWKAGAVDVMWTTVDAFTTMVAPLKEYSPKIIFQADWSRGGDAIVVRRGIESVADLKGKKVAVSFASPSHTFLLWLLDAGDIKYSEIQVVQAPSAVDAAAYFKAGKVDAAVVWSPDDEDCVTNVKGSKVLKSTREATHIIADVFFAKDSYIQSHKKELKGLVEGWMTGASEINTSDEAKKKAAKILAGGFSGVQEDFTIKAINNARLCTFGDNLNFFNMKGSYTGVKGEDIYNAMALAYNKINLAPEILPPWRQVIDTSILSSIDLQGDKHNAEGQKKFTAPTEEVKVAKAFSTKRLTITFPSGGSDLDENAKYIIQLKFGEIAKSFAAARIRIEGNTDSVGGDDMNKKLSLRRAQAVADFLIKEYKFDTNRFIVVGNGPSKPVADNNTNEGKAKNRRTDFELLSE